MGIWTRDELLALVAEWKAAYKAAATGRSYTIGSRQLTRYDLDDIRAQLSFLENELLKLSGAGGARRVLLRSVRGPSFGRRA